LVDADINGVIALCEQGKLNQQGFALK